MDSARQRAEADALIRRIVDECPRRVAASDSERKAHELLGEAFRVRNIATTFHEFRHNTHLYATLALHFAVATLGSLLFFWREPLTAAILHAIAGGSYLADSTRRFHLLRRLFPFKASRNLIATLPADRQPELRVVLIAHADAAYTGWVFNPTLIRLATAEPPIAALGFMRKSMLVATASVGVLMVLDLLGLVLGTHLPALQLAVAVVSIPSVLTFLLNLQVVATNTVVPGANDNLTGCAGAVALAERFRDTKHPAVELVFVCTGAEEAGTGGALMLARARREKWSTKNTVILGIDGLSNGELRYMQDGEIVELPVAPYLVRVAEKIAASEPRFGQVQPFVVPSGATDAMPFQSLGYDGVTFGCVDPTIGAPRHYHRPSDTPDNLDMDQFMLSVDYVEAFVRLLVNERLGLKTTSLKTTSLKTTSLKTTSPKSEPLSETPPVAE